MIINVTMTQGLPQSMGLRQSCDACLCCAHIKRCSYAQLISMLSMLITGRQQYIVTSRFYTRFVLAVLCLIGTPISYWLIQVTLFAWQDSRDDGCCALTLACAAIRLPRAATCFNTLYLPTYTTKAAMHQRLQQACSAELVFDEG